MKLESDGEILAYLSEQAAKNPGVREVIATSGGGLSGGTFIACGGGTMLESGRTVAEALAKLAAKQPTAAQRAEQLRQKAAAMLAEADALTLGGGAP